MYEDLLAARLQTSKYTLSVFVCIGWVSTHCHARNIYFLVLVDTNAHGCGSGGGGDAVVASIA